MAFRDGQRPVPGSRTTAAPSRPTKRRSRPDPTDADADGVFFLGNSYDNQYRPTRSGRSRANDALLTKAIDELQEGRRSGSSRPEDQDARAAVPGRAYGSDKLNDPAQAEPVHPAADSDGPEANRPTTSLLSRLYEDSGDYENAEATLRQGARDARPNDPAVYTTLAAYYNRQGEFDKTIEALEARAAQEPNNPEAYYTMATYYWDKAYRDFSLSDAEKVKYAAVGHRGGGQGARRSTRTTWRRSSSRTCCSASRRTSNGIPRVSRRC